MMRRSPSVPPELPGYTFVRVLGSGGFSDVFLYEQKLPKRRVAVKVLLTEELSTATRAAFVAEANLMAQLSAHPYIVTIFHADVAADDRPYFVMEYCSGPSLGDSYKRQKMSVPDALRTGVRLSSAIATAHSAGILHRDIKPANVLTNDYGWPALTDFGISSAVDDELLPVHTGTLASALAEQTGGTAGTSVGMSIPWSPPEMFDDDPQPDIRSDVFALAATLHTVLAGQTPFEVRGRSNGTLDLIGRIERGAITPIDRDDIPSSLTAVLRKGMAVDRDDRFSTAIDFARALQRVEIELGYAPTGIDVPNLLVEAAERSTYDDDDATRVRSIATIEAQTIVPPIAQRVSEAGEQTVVRPRTPAPAAPEAPEIPEIEQPTADPGVRRNRLVLLVAVGLAALVAVAVVVGLAFSGGGETGPEPTGDPTGAPAIVEGVPTPVLAAAAPEGTQVVFTVTNPDPEEGDTFRWRITSLAANEPYQTNADGRIAVDYPGGKVCIQVLIVRAGTESSNPLDQCYPE